MSKNRSSKIGIIILISIVFLAGVIVAIPFLFKDKIIAKVKTEINNKLNVTVEFSDFDLSIFRSFPNLSLGLDKLSVVGQGDFEKDTLANIEKLYLNIDIMSVIKGGQLTINAFDLDKPDLRFIVLENGKANWDIVKEDTTSSSSDESSSFKAKLQSYSISNGRLVYDDRELKFMMLLEKLDHKGKGDLAADDFTLFTQTNVDQASMSYEGVSYLTKVKTDIKADIQVNMPAFKFTFYENNIKLNAFAFSLDGFLAMPKEDIEMDLKLNSPENGFAELMSMLPGVYAADFEKAKASGVVSLAAAIKGVYGEKSMPSFNIDLKVDNGSFKYPDLPESINDVAIDLRIHNPDGIEDNTVIDLKKFHAGIGKDVIDAKVNLRNPVSDPAFDMYVNGKLDLVSITKIFPMEEGSKLAGKIDADLAMKGKMSYIDQKKYDLVDAKGNLTINNLLYTTNSDPHQTSIDNLVLRFSPSLVFLDNLVADYAGSDYQAKGTINNLLGYMLKDENLVADIALNSKLIDLNPFMQDDGNTASSDTAVAAIEIPRNIDFKINANVATLKYENLVFQQVSGAMAIKDGVLNLNDLKLNTLDGSVTMNGTYDSRIKANPEFDLNLALTGLDVQKTYQSFEVIQKMAPIAEKASGRFTTEFAVKGKMDKYMEPVLSSLTGKGRLATAALVIAGFEPVIKVADALKMDKLKQLNVTDANLSFNFIDGRVNIAPFPVKLSNLASIIGGSNGFDQTIDYVMAIQIPRSDFGGSANAVLNNLVSQANSKGLNVNPGEMINVNVKIGGTIKNPTISTGLKEAAGNVMEDLKAKAQEEFDKKKAELEAKAREEAEKLRKEAEDKFKSEKEKVEAEAERLKKEAEAKAKAEAERLKKEAADKAKKEAEDKLKGIFKPK